MVIFVALVVPREVHDQLQHMPNAVMDSFRRRICDFDSLGPGTFKHRIDQEHNNMVILQLQIMSSVSLPSD